MSEAMSNSMGAPAKSNAGASHEQPLKKKRSHRRAHKAYDARFVVGRRTWIDADLPPAA